jgi:hypothetical protein
MKKRWLVIPVVTITLALGAIWLANPTVETVELGQLPQPMRVDLPSQIEEDELQEAAIAETIEVEAAPTSPVPTPPEPEPELAPPTAGVPCVDQYGWIAFDNGRIICLFLSSDTMIDAGSRAAIWSPGGVPGSTDMFIYGHRGGVFGTIGGVSNFTITVHGGGTFNYRVVLKETACDPTNAEKGYPCSNYPGDLVVDMARAIYPSRITGGNGVTLMTCAGTILAGSDATHRLSVYAVQI